MKGEAKVYRARAAVERELAAQLRRQSQAVATENDQLDLHYELLGEARRADFRASAFDAMADNAEQA